MAPFLVDTRASVWAIQSKCFPSPPLTRQVVQAVGIFNEPVLHPVTEPLTVSIGPLSAEHAFLLSSTSPVNLLGRDLLCKLGCSIFCTPKGVYSELPETNGPSPQAAQDLLDIPLAEYTPVLASLTMEEETLLDQVNPSLWSASLTEVGHLNTDPVKVIIDPTKLLPRVSHYPLNPEAEQGIAPIIQSLLQQGVIPPCTSPCNTPILPVRKADGKTYRLVQDL